MLCKGNFMGSSKNILSLILRSGIEKEIVLDINNINMITKELASEWLVLTSEYTNETIIAKTSEIVSVSINDFKED